jgi:hypothetical protein
MVEQDRVLVKEAILAENAGTIRLKPFRETGVDRNLAPTKAQPHVSMKDLNGRGTSAPKSARNLAGGIKSKPQGPR